MSERISICLMTLLLCVGCRSDKPAEGPFERAGQDVDQAAQDTGEAVERAAKKTGAALDKAATKTEKALGRAAKKTGAALERLGDNLQGGEEGQTAPDTTTGQSGAGS